MEFVSPVLRWHMFIFRAMGYCTLPPNRNVIAGRFLISWSLMLVTLFNVMAIYTIFIDDSLLFDNDKFGHFNDALMFVSADIAVTSSYIMSIWKRSSLHEFWKCYETLQKKTNIQPRFSSRNDIWQNRRFLSIFYILITCESSMMLLSTHLRVLPPSAIMFECLFMPFIYAVHMRNLQAVFYIEIMRLELEKLKQDMQHLVDYSHFQAYGTGFQGFDEFLRLKILEKQKNYQLIYEMYEHFQNSFGFSIITVLGMIYVRLLVESYFAYYSYYRGETNMVLILVWPAFLHIPIFLITSKNCMEVVKYITLNLHNIIIQFNNQDTIVTLQVQNFSLQIRHQHICINGIGISRMDGYMLVQAIGSLTTYMIFFIQFMPILASMDLVK